MKCVKNLTTDQVVRVSDDQAKKLVQSKKWQYIGKLFWKQSGRNYGS